MAFGMHLGWSGWCRGPLDVKGRAPVGPLNITNTYVDAPDLG
jgi:hypothetical protein